MFIVTSKKYNKRDYFDFDIVDFSCLDCDVPRVPSVRNKTSTAKLLQHGYPYYNFRKAFFLSFIVNLTDILI